jgi:hypothetical protein
MHKSDQSIQRNRKLITALSALVVACGMSTPAFSAPADNDTGFRGSAGQQTTSTGGSLADDTLLVLLKPGSDSSNVRGYLANEAHANTLHEFHVNKENYSILQVQPQAGQRESTLNQINSMKNNHGELVSVGRNYLAHKLATYTPNDTYFSQQWPLTSMTWPGGYSQVVKGNVTFEHKAHITILADGCDPLWTNGELGPHINQLNATNPNITPYEDNPPHGSANTGGGEGDIDCSITGAKTNNDYVMAGTATFGMGEPYKHAYIVMLQMTTGDSVATANILNALVWCINHQDVRGGQGPVNISYGTDFPNVPLWSDPNIQALGATLRNQGDVIVMSCGDTPGTYSSSQYPMGTVLVVQGTTKNNTFFSSLLSQLSGDPLAAPGAFQPSIFGGVYNSNEYAGTSFSAPFYSSAIADVIAINPSLTALQAAHLVNSTGNQVKSAPYPANIPNFWNAFLHAK